MRRNWRTISAKVKRGWVIVMQKRHLITTGDLECMGAGMQGTPLIG
jgi:hypothetical protein